MKPQSLPQPVIRDSRSEALLETRSLAWPQALDLIWKRRFGKGDFTNGISEYARAEIFAVLVEVAQNANEAYHSEETTARLEVASAFLLSSCTSLTKLPFAEFLEALVDSLALAEWMGETLFLDPGTGPGERERLLLESPLNS